MSKLEHTQFMGAGTEGLGSLENAGVVALFPVDQLKSRISKDKQEAHDRFSLYTKTGGWLSPSRVIGDTLGLSSFYVGEQPDDERVVFGVVPKLRLKRDEEVPTEVLQAVDYARRLGLLQAISGAEKAGQISMLTALKQSVGVLGPGYKETMQAGGERFLSDQGISPETAIDILKDQRLKDVGLPAKIQEVGGVTRGEIVAKRGGDTELQGNVWQIPQEAEAKLPKGSRRISKVLYLTAAGLAVGTLVLSACAPVNSATPIPPTPASRPENNLPTPVIGRTPGGSEAVPTAPNASPTETTGNYGLATQTAEWPGVGVNVVELARALYENGGLTLANDIKKDGDEWKSIEGQGGDINGLLTAIQAELSKQGNTNATIQVVQGATGGWAFEIRAGDGSLMWSVVDGEENATKVWQQHPNRITDGSHFEKLDPKEIGLKDGEKIELAIDKGTPMGVVVDADGRIKGVFDPQTATVSRFVQEVVVEPTPTVEPPEASIDIHAELAERGVIFPEETKSVLEREDYGFVVGFSEGIFKNSGFQELKMTDGKIDIHLPEEIMDRWLLQMMGRFMYLQRNTDPVRYKNFLSLAERIHEIYGGDPVFMDNAKEILKDGPVPLELSGEVIGSNFRSKGNIANVEFNFVGKDEFETVRQTLDEQEISYLYLWSNPQYSTGDFGYTFSIDGNKLVVFGYDRYPNKQVYNDPREIKLPEVAPYSKVEEYYYRSLNQMLENTVRSMQYFFQQAGDRAKTPYEPSNLYTGGTRFICGVDPQDVEADCGETARITFSP